MKAPLRYIFSAIGLAVCALNVGCATYQNKVEAARDLLQNGNPLAAAQKLKPLADKSGNDQLVYVFDYATSLQVAGQYKLSNQYFDLADRLSDLKDYISLSREAGSLLFAQEMVQYKGDDYERLLINLMESLNYLMLGDHEDALVEVRALNNKLEYYRMQEKKSYEQNAMALYLSGLMYEDDHDFDSAYIEYQKAYMQNPAIPSLQEALVRTARLAHRDDALKKWEKQFNIKVKPQWLDPQYGELVLIYQQGWGPRKYPRPEAPEFPELYPEPSSTIAARMDIQGGPSVQTQEIYSVQNVAIKTLNDDYAALVAKRAAGYVAKEVVAAQVRQKNELLGDILDIAMHASDRADLRQWSTLPQTFQVARVFLKAGSYKVSVQGLMSGGQPSVDSLPVQTFVIRPNHKTFFVWRSFH